jgi:hypothetical protein
MAEMLLINPRKRNPMRKTRARKRNPVTTMAAPKRTRKRNPVAAMRKRVMRKRNPAGMMGRIEFMKAIQNAFIGGVGAVGVDLIQGQINTYLPATLQTVPGKVGLGDGVKAVTTVLLGHLLKRPTGGMSMKMAEGALTVQAAGIIKTFLPATMKLGYYSPATIVQGTNRVGPIRSISGVGAYTRPGVTPLLSAYTRPGTTPLLSGANNTRQREGFVFK